MKFFKGQIQKITLDNDRVLKNSLVVNMYQYLTDEMSKFNDNQLIRTLLILSHAPSSKDRSLRDKCFAQLYQNIDAGKFQFRHGSLIPNLAQAINFNFHIWFTDSEDIIVQGYLSTKIQSRSTDIFQSNTQTFLPFQYARLLSMANLLLPYCHEFFKVYQPNQKLVVLKMLHNLKIYDEALSTNFVDQITQLMSRQPIDEVMNSVCVTLHPLTAEDIDRTFELVDVIDFHLKNSDAQFPLRQELQKYLLQKMEANPDLLFEQSSYRTMYPNLFRTSASQPNETDFYEAVINKMIRHFTDDREPLIILSRLEKMMDHDLNVCQSPAARKLLALCQQRIIDEYDKIETLIAQECLIIGNAVLKNKVNAPGYDASLQIGHKVGNYKLALIKL